MNGRRSTFQPLPVNWWLFLAPVVFSVVVITVALVVVLGRVL